MSLVDSHILLTQSVHIHAHIYSHQKINNFLKRRNIFCYIVDIHLFAVSTVFYFILFISFVQMPHWSDPEWGQKHSEYLSVSFKNSKSTCID